ncbi:MAG: biotin--[acetyl-CoA-carboxylase] ligase [Christensenellales bacterium]
MKTFDFSGLLKSGVTLKHFDSVDSTNEVAKRLAAKGETNKTVVVSEEQTAGKGRLNRDWVSKKGANLMFSILLRPDFRPQDASKVPIIAAVAVAQSLRNFAKLDAKVKWPNDVLVDGKKLCGIRCEMASDFDRIEYLVVGIGVNVNQVVFPRDIAEKATSVRGETNRTISRPQLLLSILTDFFDVYTKTFEEGKFDDVIVDYTKMSILFQEMVTVHAGDRETHGKCIGFDRDGCLVMQNEQNRRIRVIAGDVSVRSEKTMYSGNLTDVYGITAAHCTDEAARTGCTVVLAKEGQSALWMCAAAARAPGKRTRFRRSIWFSRCTAWR